MDGCAPTDVRDAGVAPVPTARGWLHLRSKRARLKSPRANIWPSSTLPFVCKDPC